MVCNCDVCLLVSNVKLVYLCSVLCSGVEGSVVVSFNVDICG